MKIKTFILTFLMIMSGSILFGQNSASVANEQDLKDAIAAGRFGEMSITLTDDLEVTERINIPVGYTITINLNGKTITANKDLYAFNNLGALTIKDNVGTGVIEARGIYNGANNPDGNTPVLKIESGIFKNNATNGGAAIYNYSEVIITGGEFYGEYAAITNRGTMEISNAFIEGLNYAAIVNLGELTYGNGVYMVGDLVDNYEGTTGTVISGEAIQCVARINNTSYASFGEALTVAKATTGDVTVQIYDAVEFVNGMELKGGNYTSITFIGKSEDAKMTINQSAGGDYIEAHGKTVAFENIALAKANPKWSGNSGHMGNYFSIQGGTATYTNCTFLNGACTSGGTATYNNCTFKNESQFGLWVYDDALVTVNNSVVDSYKGIKVYSEGETSVTSTLKVENTTFTSKLAKPAVAIGYAVSVELIGNTYNNTTDVIELDSGDDADCEGITFVAQDANGNDIASTLTAVDCSKDDARCGVLMDGKIYTSVATAADESEIGNTITLLYDTEETIELPAGVALDLNNYSAPNVTIDIAGTLGKCYISEADGRTRIYGEITGMLSVKESVVVDLYSGETKLATTTLNKSEYLTSNTLGVNIVIAGEASSSWITEWHVAPIAHMIPNKAVLYLDGEEMNYAEVTLGTIDDLGEPYVWGALTGVKPSPAMIGYTGYATLQDAINAAVNGDEIKLYETLEENVTVPQAPDVAITINGNSQNYRGTITVDGKSASYETAAVTIKNFKFNAYSISKDAVINLGAARYTRYVTVENCTFTGNADNKNKVAVKSYTGGDKGLTIKDCTATGMHSLVQIKNNDLITIAGCTITNCGSGVSLDQSTNVNISGCTMDVDKYGIRVDAKSKTTTKIENCSIEAYIPVMARNAISERYTFEFNGNNTMTPANPDGKFCVVDGGKKDYEDGDVNLEDLAAPTGFVMVELNDANLSYEGVYGGHTHEAKIGNERYEFLQDALDAVEAGEQSTTIELIRDVTSDATVSQEEGKNITIDGKEFNYSGTIYIHGNARYTGAETLTIQNVNFTTEEASHDFISSNSTGAVERYAHNVTVKDCDFTSTYTGEEKNEVVAMRFRQAYNINVIGGEFTNLHSVMQANGNTGTNFEGVKANCIEGVFSMTGGAGSFSIKDSEFTSQGYGIRVGEGYNKNFNIEGCTITAPVPVAVRYAENGGPLYFTFGQNTMNSDNPYNYWFVAGTGKDEYDGGETLPEIGGQVVVNIDEDSTLAYEGVYGNYYVVKIEDTQYPSLAAALAAVENGQIIEIVRPNVGKEAAIDYPAADATDYATEFTITGGEGYQFSGITFRGDVNVTFDNAIIKTSLYALEDATINFNGNNKVNAILGTKDGKIHYNVNDGSFLDMTYGKLHANVNVYGNSNISFAEVGDAAYGNNIYMYGVTLDENTAINGANVLFVEGENTLNGATIKANDFDVNQGVTVNVEGNSSIKSSLTEGFSDINGTLNVVNAEEVYFTRLNISSEGSIVNANTNSTMVIGTISNETTGKINLAQNVVVRHADGGNSIRHFAAQDWDHEVYYEEGYYKVREIKFNFCINNVHDRSYLTFEEALANVQNGETIHITTGATGDEHSVEIDYNEEIEFTITGEAPDYKLPTVTFQNTTVNIVNSNITIAELDARQNATINVEDSDVKTCGNGSADGIAKSYFNGRIVIDNSTVYAHQATTMGYIDIINGGKLNVTWQTNVYGNGLITVEGEKETDPQVKSTLQTAAFNLTGQPYNDRDNTDEDRVGKPATVVVDGAVLIAGDVTNNNGANYSYEVDSYGINIGTIEGKAALLDIKNGSSVEFAMNPTGNHSFKSPVIGANGTVNIDASTLVVKNRIANSTDICKLQNNGVVYVTGASDINASVEGAGWFYMNGVTMSNETQLLGAKVRFASGTNNLVGSTIDDGYFQVGIGAYEGVDENVDTDNGVIVNVSDNANVGASGTTYAGWIGTGFYDTDAKKAAAMTEGVKYVLNINNSIAEFGYFHVSNDGELNVNGNAANKVGYNTSSYTFYAGNFIINGTAEFKETDVLALYTKVSCDNGTDKPGTLNIINTEYEAERHNGAVEGINFDVRKTGVVNVQGADTELYLNEYTSIAKDAKFDVKENANVTALGTITNNGTINVLAGTMTTGTAQIAAINNTSTGAITVAQGSTLDANTNITNRGKLIVNGTLNADANLYAYDNAEAELTVNGTLTQPQNGDISISLTHNSNYNNLKGNYNFGKNAVVNVNKITSSHSKMLLNIGNGAQVTAKSMNLSGSIKAISPAFIKVEDDIVCYNTITIENANLDYRTQLKSVDESYGIIFEGTNNLTNAILTDSKVTVNSGATLTVSAGSYYNNNNINVASLTNNGTLIVGNYANVNVTNTVSNKATAIVNGTLTAATLNNNSYNKTLTVNGTLTATTSLYNAANATINGSGNIKADASTVIELTNDGEIEGDLTISAKTIYNYNKIDVAEIVATDFYNTNMTYSSVIVDDATLQSVSFTNSGTVNVTGEFSKVLITNEVTGTGQFVMEGVNLTSGNTMLHGAYIVFNEENSATGLTFGSDINNSITVNGTLNIFGDVIAKGLGICGEVGAKVVLNENSTLTAHSGLKLYPEADPFVTPYDKDYHVVESPAENSKSVYSLNPNSDYVAMVKNDEDYDTGIFYETVQGAIDAAVDGNTIEILKSTIDESEIKVVGKKLTFKSDNGIVVNGTFTAQAEVTFKHAVQFEKLYVNATDARLIIENGAAVTVTGATIMSLTSRIVLRGDARFYTTDSTLDKVISESDDYRAIYDAAGKYYYLVSSYVAEVGGVEYPTLQEAIDNATVEAKVITLLAKYGQPIPMNACVEGKEVTITTNNEEIDVDWSKGSLFVGRHADNTISGGDATLKFENANLVSTSFETLHSNGLNISGRHKDGHAYNGTVNVVNSTIEVDYILVRNAMNIENSKVVVKGDNGYTTPAGSKCNVLIGGRPDNETTTQDHATAKLNLVNSTLEVENHIRTNYEGRGEMDIDATSTVVAESIYAPRLSKVNSEGNIFAHLEEQIANLIVLKGGVYTEDVNAFCATGYSAYPCEYETEYPFTSFWAVRESHGSQTIKLVGKTSEGTGWNYVSSYMKNFDLTDLQNGIVEGGVTTAQIWSQADGIRSLTSNGWTGANNLTVSPAQMYKIYVDKDANVTLQEGDYVDYGTYEMTLEHGWNWIGYPVTKSMMVSDAFEIVKDGEVIIFPSEYDEIKDNQGHSAYFEDGVWYDDFELVPGRGYMYLHNGEEAITFTYPNEVTVPSTTPQRETKYWNAPVGFASTMTMVAMVNIDGEFVDGNYEVAAFANGELRGSARPIYVESRNAYYLLMSIGGSKVEELTFKYYDVNYGTEYELDNRINFTSDVRLGSFDEPYVLTMNITDIEEVTLSDINIYPNPTTTGVQVNLDATCEKVEIFNALGVKVAEYQNVDSIDAFETAGIYVIRLTNGGEIKHTRLVVK